MLARWFNRRAATRVEQHAEGEEEVDAEARSNSTAAAVTQEQGAAPPLASSTPPPPPPPAPAPLARAMDHVNKMLSAVSIISKTMMALTFFQIMCTLQVEQVHFLTLYSLFVPWTGFEGVKERNFAYIRLYYWGCLIMIPANFIHYYSFDEYVNQVLAMEDSKLTDADKRELYFNQVLFSVVTCIITFLMCISVIIVNRVSRFRALFQPDHQQQQRVPGQGGGGGGGNGRDANGGLLTASEIAALPRCKIETKEEAAEICVICQDEFTLGDTDVKRLHCKHMFHASCIDAWLERSSLCPICNGDVRSIV